MPRKTYSAVLYTPDATKVSLKSKKAHTAKLDLTSISHSLAKDPVEELTIPIHMLRRVYIWFMPHR